ncbi:MAG: hypothetical protein LC768_03290 [Acidobacteria bacterium]|nr:hypothetical protein [Acidobacteriota bacterium]MCA1637352.1 hypothetical protein [Acidobacteriota bacterium]
MKIAVALSGGVDSSSAAALLKEQEHELVGFTMQLWSGTESGFINDNAGRCGGLV